MKSRELSELKGAKSAQPYDWKWVDSSNYIFSNTPDYHVSAAFNANTHDEKDDVYQVNIQEFGNSARGSITTVHFHRFVPYYDWHGEEEYEVVTTAQPKNPAEDSARVMTTVGSICADYFKKHHKTDYIILASNSRSKHRMYSRAARNATQYFPGYKFDLAYKPNQFKPEFVRDNPKAIDEITALISEGITDFIQLVKSDMMRYQDWADETVNEANPIANRYPKRDRYVRRPDMTYSKSRPEWDPTTMITPPLEAEWYSDNPEWKYIPSTPIGITGINTNIHYAGIQVSMKPSTFLELAVRANELPNVEKIKAHIKLGGKIASPFLKIDTLGKIARVVGHEGRNRMAALLQLYGDEPVEVHLYFSGDLKRRHIDKGLVKKINKQLIPEKRDAPLTGPFFTVMHELVDKASVYEEIVDEDIANELYHYTTAANAYNIFKDGKIKLTNSLGTRAEAMYAPKGKPYFLSMSRSKVGDYHRWPSTGGVVMVMDADWLRTRYEIKAIDYWDRAWLHPGSERSRESEDRLFSKDESLPLDSVKELHIFYKEREDNRAPKIRKLLILAKIRGIKTYVYDNAKSWKLQDTRRALPLSAISDRLSGDDLKRDVYRDPTTTKDVYKKNRHRYRYLARWLELIFKNRIEDLSKEADKKRYDLLYYGSYSQRDDMGLEVDLGNERKPGAEGYRDAVKIQKFMKKHKIETVHGLVDYLKTKWKDITDKRDQTKKLNEIRRFNTLDGSIEPQGIKDYLYRPKKLFDFTSESGKLFSIYNDGNYDDFFVAVDHTGKVQMSVEGRYTKRKLKRSTFWIYTLTSAKNRQIRASEFYKQLILRLNLVLVSDASLSNAGAAVWQRLSQDPQLKTYLFNKRTKKIWNIPASQRAEFLSNDDDIRYVAQKK